MNGETAVRIVAGVVSITVMIGTALAANLTMLSMLDEVNGKRGAGSQIDWIGWGPFKRASLFSEHAGLFPNSSLRKRFWILCGVAVAALAICAVCLSITM